MTNAAADNAPERFSDVLEGLSRRDGDRLTLAEMIDAFGERALGAVMVLLATISLLPWPPGGKIVFSLPLILIAAEVMTRRDRLWLPKWVMRRSVSRTRYASGMARAIGPIRFIERLSKPRMAALTDDNAQIGIGLICILLAVMLAFPVPFGDMLPAVTITIFGFALMQRDGLAMIAGLVGTVLCGAYLVLVWRTVVHVIQAGAGWVQSLGG